MSTILDSLKKSSNKRDDQEKNSIDNFNFSNSKKSSKSGIIMIVFLILVTAIILFFGYQYINNNVDNPENKTGVKDGTPQVVEQNSNKATAPVEKTNGDIKSIKLQKPNSEAVRQQLVETKSLSEPTKTTIENTDLNQFDKTKNDTNRNTLNSTNTASQEITQLTDQSTVKKPMLKLSLPDEENKQSDKKESGVKKQDHLYVYQLPFSVRKEMPKFILNIHIYDENPENRVAVINGVKYAVNDLIDEQVLIKEIVREGVLLEFNEYVFLIPII